MTRALLIFVGLSGAICVTLGAFTAHGLDGVLDAQGFKWVETGLRYQALHTLALIGVAAFSVLRPTRLLGISAALFAGGIVLFSGALYALAFTGVEAFGSVTPFGGVGLIAGWLAFAGYGVTFRAL